MNNGEFSEARLGRMRDVMAGHVGRGVVPGVVTLLSRRGEVQVDAIGTKAFGGNEPMRRDTIFRIASVTKPIVAAAAMILVEEAVLRLDDPVDPLLPELADRQVLRRIDGPLAHQRGGGWIYNTGADRLAVPIAGASDMGLGEFPGGRVYTPLGMNDT